MSSITFDTHKFITTLKEAGFNEKQAEAVTSAFKEATSEELATSHDLQLLEKSIDLKLETQKSDLIKWIAGLLLAQAAIIATLVKLL